MRPYPARHWTALWMLGQMASLGINKKSGESASSKNHLRTMETEETLTPGPPQTERVFLSETILRLRGIHDHERYSYLGPYYAFVTSKRLLKIRNFFFFFCVSIPSLGKKFVSVSSLHHSALMHPSWRDFSLCNHSFPQFEAVPLPLLDLHLSCFIWGWS